MTFGKHVIDTNVLLVASAAHETSPFSEDATPVEESVLREKVLDWLISFEDSERQIVLDWEWIIVDEYKGVNRREKLTEQDYGMLVVLDKWSKGQCVGFTLTWDEPESATITDVALSPVVVDHADRKMVAAVLAAGGFTGGCNLVNSCDTDWYDWQEELELAGIIVQQLIGAEWCYPKWLEKQAR
ncbi:hypothetical protein ACV1C5_21945 [Aeromonas caviae]